MLSHHWSLSVLMSPASCSPRNVLWRRMATVGSWDRNTMSLREFKHSNELLEIAVMVLVIVEVSSGTARTAGRAGVSSAEDRPIILCEEDR